MTLLSENGQRSGVACNMTLTEHRAMKRLQEKSEDEEYTFIIRAAAHKTGTYFGAARITLNNTTRIELAKYIYMRKRRLLELGIDEDACENIFLRWIGTPIAAHYIHRIFEAVFPSTKSTQPLPAKRTMKG